MAVDHRPTFSIIIESENLAVEDSAMLLAALASLHNQTVSVGEAEEVILVNSGKIPEDVETTIRQQYPLLRMYTIEEGATYYEAKQNPVALTTGEVIVFCDSDCKYSTEWLESLLAPYSDPDILADVVTGATSVSLDGFHSYFVALNWCFPVQTNHSVPVQTDGYAANNVSFRRNLLSRHPLPTSLRLYRGNCTLHARELLEKGTSIWKAPRAGAIHPALRPTHVPARFFMWGHHEAKICRARYADSGNALIRTVYRTGAMLRTIARRLVMPFVRWPALLRSRPASMLYIPPLLVYIAIADLFFIAGVVATLLIPSMTLLQLGRMLEASEHG